nr:hypothetical protein [Burkholderia pyrrocinia]
MCLDVIDVSRRHAGALERLADHVPLRSAVRRGHPVAATVVIDRGAADHRTDRSALLAGVGQAHQRDDSAALAAHVAVGGRVERPATPAWRQCLKLAQRDRHLRRQHQVHAAGECDVGLAGAQAVAGQMYGDERRRTGGVEMQRRAVKAEQVGNAAGREGARGAQRRLRVAERVVGHAFAYPSIVVDRRADKHTGAVRCDRLS